jgi:hypothetical protein
MVLGALVDAGCDLAAMEAELRKLRVTGWTISAEKVKRGALAATQVRVSTTETHHHRGLSKILEHIAAANLAPRVAERASAIFQKLGEAEARIHNVPVEKIHFHEVGAVDAIVDIVGAAIGFELLGLEGFACSALNVGGGRVDTAHGNLPVPAPATADLLRGAPSYSTGIERELVTPTGAAIVSTLATEFGPLPAMVTQAIGYGAGGADLKEQPNVLRLFIGESAAKQDAAKWGHAEECVSVIEANIDDMNPQIYGYFVERALAAGALDVFATSVQMKKNRPGQLLTVLCEPSVAERLIDLIFRETTTIGVRIHKAHRRTLERESVPVETRFGTVRVKVSRGFAADGSGRANGTILNAAPEYEDCQRLAREKNVPLKQVLAEAAHEFEKRHGKPH